MWSPTRTKLGCTLCVTGGPDTQIIVVNRRSSSSWTEIDFSFTPVLILSTSKKKGERPQKLPYDQCSGSGRSGLCHVSVEGSAESDPRVPFTSIRPCSVTKLVFLSGHFSTPYLKYNLRYVPSNHPFSIQGSVPRRRRRRHSPVGTGDGSVGVSVQRSLLFVVKRCLSV